MVIASYGTMHDTCHDETLVPADAMSDAASARDELRQRIVAMRQAKRREAPQRQTPQVLLSCSDGSPASTMLHVPGGGCEDRFSWVNVEEDESDDEEEVLGCREAKFGDHRASETEDDSESTVLGHLSAFPSTPGEPCRPLAVEAPIATRDNSHALRHSNSSLQTTSSITSTSIDTNSQEDEDDSHSVHTLLTLDESSDHASRKASSQRSDSRANKRQSGARLARPGTASSVRSTLSTTSRPLGPPPDLPLPPKPLHSPVSLRSPGSPAWPAWSRSSHLEAWSTDSFVAASVRGKFSSTRSSSRLSDNELSDQSADEISSIRRISAFFPPPAGGPLSPRSARSSSSRPGSATGQQRRVKAERHFSSRSASRSSNGRRSSPIRSPRRPSTFGASDEAFTSTVAERRPCFGSGAMEGMTEEVDEVEQEATVRTHARRPGDDDDVAGSDGDSNHSGVLEMTARQGVLAVAQRASPVSAGQIARVGLGPRSPAGRTPSQPSQPRSCASASSSSRPHDSTEAARKEEERRKSLLRKSLNGLVVALDLKAVRWSLDSQGNSPVQTGSISPDTTSSAPPPPPKETTERPAEEREHPSKAELALQEVVARSTAAPDWSGSSSVSGEREAEASSSSAFTSSAALLEEPVKLEGASAATAAASLTPVASASRSNGWASGIGAPGPQPTCGPLPTSSSAPTVRIHPADGGAEKATSEIDPTIDEDDDGDDFDDVDDIPRKRTKQARRQKRTGFGFEDQRATLSRGPNSRSSQQPVREGVQASASSSRSLQVGQIFHPPGSQSPSGESQHQQQPSDPYAFYEFSPSLPPFVPAGLQPRDLTGTGTWSSIVARANSTLTRQTSMLSIASGSSQPATHGPVSLREVAAGARAKMEQAEAARRARESQSELFASLSYRPFEIHQHATSEARALGRESSILGEPSGGRNTVMSSRLSSTSTMSMGELANRWPVAVGEEDREVEGGGSGTGTSTIPTARSSPVGLGINNPYSPYQGARPSPGPAKVYVEFCVQTSPASTPPPSPKRPMIPMHAGSADDADPDLEQTPQAAEKRRRASTRRKTMVVLSRAYGIDLETPDFKATHMRAPRLSSRKSDVGLQRVRSTASLAGRAAVASTSATAVAADAEDEEVLMDSSDSSDESDLDVGAPLAELADRTGVLNLEIRGAKRKLRRGEATPSPGQPSGSGERAIATIPLRARSSAPRASRAANASSTSPRRRRIDSGAGTGWTSSEGESDDDDSDSPSAGPSHQFRTPQPTRSSGNFQLRPLLLPRSVPAKSGKNRVSSLRRPSPGDASAAASVTSATSSEGRAGRASRLALLRSASPDLSFSALAGGGDEDGDDSLLSTKLDEGGDSSLRLLDDDDDISARDARARAAIGPSLSPRGHSDRSRPHMLAAPSLATARRESNAEAEEAVEVLREAEDTVSSAGHGQGPLSSLGHGSVSDSCGTSGHDPQRRPNDVLAEMVRQRLAIRLATALSGGVPLGYGPLDRSVRSVPTAQEASGSSSSSSLGGGADGAVEAEMPALEQSSPVVQDTPNTMASSDAWSTFRTNDRDSSASTVTSWSGGSFVEPERAVTGKTESAVVVPHSEGVFTAMSADDETAASTAPALATETTAKPAATSTTASARSSNIARTLQRKASGLPMLSSSRRSTSESVVGSSGSSMPAEASRPSSIEARAATPSSFKQMHAVKKAQRPSLPPPVAYARHAQAMGKPKPAGGSSSSSSGIAAPGEQWLRKMKSFGDRSSNTFVPPPASTLPRHIVPPKARAPVALSLDSAAVRRRSGKSTIVGDASTPSKLSNEATPPPPLPPLTLASARPSGTRTLSGGARPSSLKHQASLQNLSRLPTPSTLRPSGLPTPSGLPRKR